MALTDIGFFFWNIRGMKEELLVETTEDLLSDLNCKPDILIFAEFRLDTLQPIATATKLTPIANAPYRGRNHKIGRLVVLSSQKGFKLSPLNNTKQITNTDNEFMIEYGHLSFLELETSEGTYLIAVMHLASKLGNDPTTQREYAEDYRTIINEQKLIQKRKSNYKGTILIGDFNLNPFDWGMYYRKGFHSTNFASSIKHEYFNPMFSLLGNYIYKTSIPKAPATYLLEKLDIQSPHQMHWNLLDNVIFEPSLMNNFVPEALQIIEKISDKHKLFEKGLINQSYSDHLPIYFKFKL